MHANELELRKFVVPEIISGEGASTLVNRYLTHFTAKKPMIVTDHIVRKQDWFQEILGKIEEQVEEVVIFDDVTPNPKDYEAMMGSELLLSHECDIIIAIGGGSPMDCAKCISIVSTNGGHVLDYEGVDQVNLPGPPLICIPSTAGTAADVSQFAIVNDTSKKVKKAIISKKVVPDLALIDPVPLMTMDFYLTACTGMDVLTHAIEAYVSNAASTFTDIHALEAIKLVHENLRAACSEKRTIYDLYYMMIASTEAGMAFSNASLGAVHAMAHSLGGLFDLPHGECNSVLLEHVIDFNYESATKQYNEIASVFGIDLEQENEVIKKKLMQAIRELREDIKIKSKIKVEKSDEGVMEQLCSNSLLDPCMLTNPKELTKKEVGEIYERILTEE